MHDQKEILKLPAEIPEVGLIGEFRVLYELRRRGHTALKVEGVKGVDIIILGDNNKKIQVKTARRGFSISKGHKHANYAVFLSNLLFDFLICWTIDGDMERFYIIPVKELKTNVNRIYPNSKRWLEYEGAWSLLSDTENKKAAVLNQ